MDIAPAQVHETLARSMLVEGYPFVLDLAKSHGQRLHDARTGREYLDFFTFYASRPVAFDHPRLKDPAYLERLHRAAAMKPSNCDIYTDLFAEFAETFRRHALGPGMTHLFVIEGGALAVENALKAAFDWKAQRNAARGKGENPGRVLHFQHAFHGRSGYTLSLTNTADPRKTRWFPKFDWPRVPSPAMSFPLTAERDAALEAQEKTVLSRIDQVYHELGEEEIACIIVEPIQCEGGDRHLSKRFLSALRKICDERETILIFDEVQTGMGSTGTRWYYEQLGVTPDAVAFAKKAQTGGFMAGKRFDEVDSVFKVKSRISSTFGGNLVDMVRCTRYLEIVHEDGLLANAAEQGRFLLERVSELVSSNRGLSNPRGAGLVIAFDAPDGEARDRIIGRARDEGLLLLPCGDRSVRLRPALDVSRADCEAAMGMIARGVRSALAEAGKKDSVPPPDPDEAPGI